MDMIYTTTTGGTVYLNGQRGTLTGLKSEGHTFTHAFVRLDGPVDNDGTYIAPGPMLYVTLGGRKDEGANTWREAVSWRVIDRDEFDRINEIDTLRRDLGWS